MANEITPPNIISNTKERSLIEPELNDTTPKIADKPQETAPLTAKIVRPKVKAKPLIEGINAPRTTSDISYFKEEPATEAPHTSAPAPLTDPEKTLIATSQDFKKETPKLISDTSKINLNKVGPKYVKWVLLAVIMLIILAGGYLFYQWYFDQQPKESSNQPEQIVINQQPAITEPTEPIATTTVFVASSSAPALPVKPEVTPTTTPPTVTNLTVTKTPTGFLNVRTLPSLSGTIITKVHPGDIYQYTAKKNGWYQITINDGAKGWVIGIYVKVQ